MPHPSKSLKAIVIPRLNRQVAFRQLLLAARNTWLRDALAATLKDLEPDLIGKELSRYAPAGARRLLASAGVRDEYVFPIPLVIRSRPTLVGYYRLLSGISQKQFYRSNTGLGPFHRVEASGLITPSTEARLTDFCRAMGERLAELIAELNPRITDRDVSELQLLTLGSQFQGANNVTIGKQATADVFLAIAELVAPFVVSRTATQLTLRNPANRELWIELAADPDVCIRENMVTGLRSKVAIEIKGGTDSSNAHNRAGEAEKSHQKAKRKDYRDFWTIIAMQGLDKTRLREESPTTTSWFEVAHVLARDGVDWDEFKSRLLEVLGLPLTAGHGA